MSFIDKLYELMSAKKVTRKQLSADLSLGKNALSNWKKRGNIPDGETLVKLAVYFGVSVDFLLGKEKPAVSEEEQPGREVMIRAKRALADLSDEELEKVLEYAEYVKSRQTQ